MEKRGKAGKKEKLENTFPKFSRSELCLTHFDKMWTKTGELCVEVSKNYNAQPSTTTTATETTTTTATTRRR